VLFALFVGALFVGLPVGAVFGEGAAVGGTAIGTIAYMVWATCPSCSKLTAPLAPACPSCGRDKKTGKLPTS